MMLEIGWKGEAAPLELAMQPLDSQAFAPFGQVVQVGSHPKPANGGTARRHDIGDVLGNRRPQAKLLLSVFDCEPCRLPLRIGVLERHCYSAQTIIPMQADPYAVIVCLDDGDGRPNLATLRAFSAQAGQGINYAPGIWHHGIIALGRQGLFFLQSWQDDTAADCEEAVIPDIVLAPPHAGRPSKVTP